MASRRSSASRSRNRATQNAGGYKPRRDWSKIAFYTFSIVIVLSMVLALFIQVLQVM